MVLFTNCNPSYNHVEVIIWSNATHKAKPALVSFIQNIHSDSIDFLLTGNKSLVLFTLWGNLVHKCFRLKHIIMLLQVDECQSFMQFGFEIILGTFWRMKPEMWVWSIFPVLHRLLCVSAALLRWAQDGHGTDRSRITTDPNTAFTVTAALCIHPFIQRCRFSTRAVRILCSAAEEEISGKALNLRCALHDSAVSLTCKGSLRLLTMCVHVWSGLLLSFLPRSCRVTV